MVQAWRIVKRRYARNAWSGEGARRFGGRWNRPGVVYVAASRALAALELLVHLESSDLLATYVVFEIAIPERWITVVDRLPADWRADPPPASTRAIGDRWLEEGRYVAMRVPSVIVPNESNFVLNPAHADFVKLRIGKAEPFRFDSRLRR